MASLSRCSLTTDWVAELLPLNVSSNSFQDKQSIFLIKEILTDRWEIRAQLGVLVALGLSNQPYRYLLYLGEPWIY